MVKRLVAVVQELANTVLARLRTLPLIKAILQHRLLVLAVIARVVLHRVIRHLEVLLLVLIGIWSCIVVSVSS